MAPTGLRSDPFPAFKFVIALINSSSVPSLGASVVGAALGGFSECSGLEASMQVEEYIEGGENNYVHKFAGRITHSNLVLRRGVTLSEDLWNWYYSFIQGKGKRRDGVITLQNELGIPVKVWTFKRGLPLKWSGPTFNAAQSAVAVESIEIAHEGIDLLSLGAAVGQILSF